MLTCAHCGCVAVNSTRLRSPGYTDHIHMAARPYAFANVVPNWHYVGIVSYSRDTRTACHLHRAHGQRHDTQSRRRLNKDSENRNSEMRDIVWLGVWLEVSRLNGERSKFWQHKKSQGQQRPSFSDGRNKETSHVCMFHYSFRRSAKTIVQLALGQYLKCL